MTTKFFSTNTDSDDVTVVDAATLTPLATIDVGGSPRGSVRVSPDGTRGYVSNTAGNTISVLDLVNNTEISRITVGCSPRGIVLSPNGTKAFVSNSGEDKVAVVDLITETVIHFWTVGKNPRHGGITADGKKLVIAVWGEDKVTVLEGSLSVDDPNWIPTNMVQHDIPVGANARPYSVAIDNANARAFSANTQANYISQLNLNNYTLVQNIQVGYGSRAIVIGPAGSDEIYVTVESTSEIAVVKVSSATVDRRYDVGPGPRGIGMTSDNASLVVAAFSREEKPGANARNSLTVVRRADGLLIDQIAVGLGPCSVSMR